MLLYRFKRYIKYQKHNGYSCDKFINNILIMGIIISKMPRRYPETIYLSRLTCTYYPFDSIDFTFRNGSVLEIKLDSHEKIIMYNYRRLKNGLFLSITLDSNMKIINTQMRITKFGEKGYIYSLIHDNKQITSMNTGYIKNSWEISKEYYAEQKLYIFEMSQRIGPYTNIRIIGKNGVIAKFAISNKFYVKK